MDLDRHIDTTGLPLGFDGADLIESGIIGQKLIDWCKQRVHPGPPSLSQDEMTPPKKKTTPKSNGKTASHPVKTNIVALPDPVPELHVDIPPEFSEDSLAEEFTKRYQKSLAYCTAWGQWLNWDENGWKNDDTALAVDLSRKVCRDAALTAMERLDLGAKAKTIATTLTSRKCITSVEGIARSDRRHVVRPTQFDADPWLLSTPTGVLDLQSGVLRPAKQDDWCLKQTMAGPGGDCPTWRRFLTECTEGDAELEGYLQRIAGYCLTGSISEQKFFFIYGGGGSGKGTWLNTIRWLLNTYGRQANMDTFTEQRFSKHASEIAFFQGARLVVASETNAGQRWNEARITGMTGGDALTANWMAKDPFTFMPQFKLIFMGNHKPHLKNVGREIKRRLYMIPFEHIVPDSAVDGLLPEKLQAEASGILDWALAGCLEWQKTGLRPPERVLAATNEYFDAEDRIQNFLDDCCEVNATYVIQTSRLFQRFSRWAEGQGEYSGGRKGFLDLLAVKGFHSIKIGGDQLVNGLRVTYIDPGSDPGYSF